MQYQKKYLKYKNKYLNLKKYSQFGGVGERKKALPLIYQEERVVFKDPRTLYEAKIIDDHAIVIAFMDDEGRRLLAMTSGEDIILYDVTDTDNVNKIVTLPTTFTNSKKLFVFRDNENRQVLVSGGQKGYSWDYGRVTLWDVSNVGNIQILREFEFEATPSHSHSFAVLKYDNKQVLVSGGEERPTKFWDIDTGYEINLFDDTGATAMLSFDDSNSGKQLLAVGHDRSNVTLLDISNLGDIHVLYELGDIDVLYELGYNWVNSLVTFLDSDNKQVLAGSYGDGTIKLWDVNTGREIITLDDGGREIIRSLAILWDSNNKPILADSNGKLWDVNTGDVINSLNRKGRSVVVFNDGNSIPVLAIHSQLGVSIFKEHDINIKFTHHPDEYIRGECPGPHRTAYPTLNEALEKAVGQNCGGVTEKVTYEVSAFRLRGPNRSTDRAPSRHNETSYVIDYGDEN